MYQWLELAAVLVQTLLLALAAIFAWYQIRESSRARVASTLLEIFQTIHSDANTSDRALLFSGEKTPESDAAARRTVELFEWISLLVRRKMLPTRIVLDMYSDLFVDVWATAEPLVSHARRYMTNYAEHLEHVAKEARDFRASRYPSDTGLVERAFRRGDPQASHGPSAEDG